MTKYQKYAGLCRELAFDQTPVSKGSFNALPIGKQEELILEMHRRVVGSATPRYEDYTRLKRALKDTDHSTLNIETWRGMLVGAQRELILKLQRRLVSEAEPPTPPYVMAPYGDAW